MTPLLVVAGVVLAILLAVVVVRGGRSERLVYSTPPSPTEVQRLIAAGETIEAVRMYRQLTGSGLYESKQAIDRIRTTGVWEVPSAPAPAGEADESDEDVVTLVREKRLIEAIQRYREKHGVDLTTAKNAVDRLAGRS